MKSALRFRNSTNRRALLFASGAIASGYFTSKRMRETTCEPEQVKTGLFSSWFAKRGGRSTPKLDSQTGNPQTQNFPTSECDEAKRLIDEALGLQGQDKSRAVMKLKKAISIADSLIAAHPKFSDAYLQLGRALLVLNNPSEAMDMFNEAINHDGRNASAWYYKGFAFLNGGKPKEALECLENVNALAPKLVDAWRLKAEAHSQLGNLEEALKSCTGGLEIDANDRRLLERKGRFAVLTEKNDIALETFSKLLELDPKNKNALLEKVKILENISENHGETLELVESAVTLYPDDYEFHYAKGRVLMLLAQHEQSIKHFQRAYEIQPDPSIMYSLSLVFTFLGKTKEADEAMEKYAQGFGDIAGSLVDQFFGSEDKKEI